MPSDISIESYTPRYNFGMSTSSRWLAMRHFPDFYHAWVLLCLCVPWSPHTVITRSHWLWYIQLFSKRKQHHLCVNNDEMVRHWWRRPDGAFGDNGTYISIVTTTGLKSISTLYSFGYGSSSSSVRRIFLLPLHLKSHFYVGSMYDDIYASM